MDLALEIGCTRGELGDRITERELGDWVRYVEQKGLPMQRLEYLLARILMVLDLAHIQKPGTRVNLADYLPGAKPVTKAERATREIEQSMANEKIGGHVIKRRKK